METDLVTTLSASLVSLVDKVTAMQGVVFGAAIAIVVGFVAYRLIKQSSNKI